jgi:hypothetical protein
LESYLWGRGFNAGAAIAGMQVFLENSMTWLKGAQPGFEFSTTVSLPRTFSQRNSNQKEFFRK